MMSLGKFICLLSRRSSRADRLSDGTKCDFSNERKKKPQTVDLLCSRPCGTEPTTGGMVKNKQRNNGPFESYINKVDFGREQIFGVRCWLGHFLSLRSHGCCVLAQRGGSCAIVLTENMFFSSCVTQRRLKCLWVPFSFFLFLTPLPTSPPSCCTSPGTHVRMVPLSMWPSWVLFVRK